ncbi:MEDS domain-containing protein [Sporosarcina obsidiansis]|uniref:MEDS domain-containing protein n=1 Tax=Sporosarcina obsidiansis TaxID=2660748 RepID=UPI00129B923E|nr:MEDS domain-containing protein [Sporosarcina obsidiansis]
MKSNMQQLFERQRNTHVLYSYENLNKYVDQAVTYIEDGVKAGEYTIIIENERIYPLIQKELSKRITKEQMPFVHFVNNFHFYYSSGSYHPPAIVNYFEQTVQRYVENKLSFRSWAHVEWATMKGPLHIIKELEIIIDEAVNELSFPLICAYAKERMPDYLLTLLLETHPLVLINDELILSNQYLKNV